MSLRLHISRFLFSFFWCTVFFLNSSCVCTRLYFIHLRLYFNYFMLVISFMTFYIYLYTRERHTFMFFMFSFLISASCRSCNLKFAYSYIEDLSYCLREFSLVVYSHLSLFRFSRRRSRHLFAYVGWLPSRALARESGIRETAIWFYYETIIGMYSPYTECKYETSFDRLSVRFLFIAGSRERSSRSVTSLALRRSPSCKTRFTGYTTIARLSGRRGKEEGRTKKTKGRKKKGGEISLLFWE